MLIVSLIIGSNAVQKKALNVQNYHENYIIGLIENCDTADMNNYFFMLV